MLKPSYKLALIILIITTGCNNSKNKGEQKISISVESNTISFKEKGMKYALKAKGVLGKNLINAISSKGTANAMSFCNEKAYHLTDSVAKSLNVHIKRVSDRYRNPSNKANSDELAYIKIAKKQLTDGEKVLPEIQEIDDKVVGYYPIISNSMCLQCHGNPSKEIEKNTFLKINELYPNDLAIGYSSNELRGVWVVTMPKE